MLYNNNNNCYYKQTKPMSTSTSY